MIPVIFKLDLEGIIGQWKGSQFHDLISIKKKLFKIDYFGVPFFFLGRIMIFFESIESEIKEISNQAPCFFTDIFQVWVSWRLGRRKMVSQRRNHYWFLKRCSKSFVDVSVLFCNIFVCFEHMGEMEFYFQNGASHHLA